ncbi:hypothetical protein QE152_g35629 [Popillia japonica]|uniref:Uncharacterized protein n=1 Tax=Popillia japonica TaxID=7064 RepID=A0AAW1IFD2_POPJA
MEKRADREEGARSLQVLQERWEAESRGRWTPRLIRDLSNWICRQNRETGWKVELEAIEEGLGLLSPDGIIQKMIDTHREAWNKVTAYVEKILKTKKREVER